MTNRIRSKCPLCETEYTSHDIPIEQKRVLKEDSVIMQVSCDSCGNIYNPLVKGEWL